mgnify:CR=1 FL=1
MSENGIFAEDYEFENDFEKEREKCTIMSIKSNTKEIAVDTALLAAEAFAIGVGTLGTYIYGTQFIDCIKNKESNIKVLLKGVPVVLSASSVFVGVKGIQDTKEKLQKHILDRKRHKNNLKSFNKWK